MSDFERKDKLAGPPLYEDSDGGATGAGSVLLTLAIVIFVIAVVFG